MTPEETTSDLQKHPASYRDPSGYVFLHNGAVYRQVNKSFSTRYELLMQSGAYQDFAGRQWLVAHKEVDTNLTGDAEHYKTLLPSPVHFISYAYEWSFSMLQDAALLTLDLAINSTSYGLMLKDANTTNIQFVNGRPVFIDTLSFEAYDSSKPWIAYRQFCENFLAPLVLMHYTGQPLQPLLLGYPDGIPLAVAARLLPARSRFNLSVFLHIHLHAGIGRRPAATTSGNTPSFSKTKMLNLLKSLRGMVAKLSPGEKGSVWAGYYDEASTRQGYLEHKKELITSIIAKYPQVRKVADLGANEGEFAVIAAKAGRNVLAADLDPFCVERLYRLVKNKGIHMLHPLVIDLANPSPANGLNGTERLSFLQRCNADMVFALALIHHLVIGKNISFERIALMMASLAEYLVIEWVPLDDPKAALVASQKKIDYVFYTADQFSIAFKKYFTITESYPVKDSYRIIYVMKRRD